MVRQYRHTDFSEHPLPEGEPDSDGELIYPDLCLFEGTIQYGERPLLFYLAKSLNDEAAIEVNLTLAEANLPLYSAADAKDERWPERLNKLITYCDGPDSHFDPSTAHPTYKMLLSDYLDHAVAHMVGYVSKQGGAAIGQPSEFQTIPQEDRPGIESMLTKQGFDWDIKYWS